MKYLTKVFNGVIDYPMSFMNKIARKKLKNNQSMKRTGETNKTINKFQLILQYSGKQRYEVNPLVPDVH